MYGSMEESPPAEAPALGPAEIIEGKDAAYEGYWCPRRPLTHSVDVGDKSMSAEEIRTILSPPPPLESCAAASTGACLERGAVEVRDLFRQPLVAQRHEQRHERQRDDPRSEQREEHGSASVISDGRRLQMDTWTDRGDRYTKVHGDYQLYTSVLRPIL